MAASPTAGAQLRLELSHARAQRRVLRPQRRNLRRKDGVGHSRAAVRRATRRRGGARGQLSRWGGDAGLGRGGGQRRRRWRVCPLVPATRVARSLRRCIPRAWLHRRWAGSVQRRVRRQNRVARSQQLGADDQRRVRDRRQSAPELGVLRDVEGRARARRLRITRRRARPLSLLLLADNRAGCGSSLARSSSCLGLATLDLGFCQCGLAIGSDGAAAKAEEE